MMKGVLCYACFNSKAELIKSIASLIYSLLNCFYVFSHFINPINLVSNTSRNLIPFIYPKIKNNKAGTLISITDNPTGISNKLTKKP